MAFEIHQLLLVLSYLFHFFLGSAATTFPADANGICHTYTVQAGDTCKVIAKNKGITVNDIEKYNKNTFDWKTCALLAQGRFICLGPGQILMPVALPNAVCGPQVPGTARPHDMSNLRELNPCPSHQCVNHFFFVSTQIPCSRDELT